MFGCPFVGQGQLGGATRVNAMSNRAVLSMGRREMSSWYYKDQIRATSDTERK